MILYFQVGEITWVAMRRILYYVTAQGEIVGRDDLMGNLCEEVLCALACAEKMRYALQALRAAGGPDNPHHNIEEVLRTFRWFALVCLGAKATSYWRQQDAKKAKSFVVVVAVVFAFAFVVIVAVVVVYVGVVLFLKVMLLLNSSYSWYVA